MGNGNKIFDPYKRVTARSQRDVDKHVRDVTTDPFAEKKKRARRAAQKKRAAGRGPRR